MRVPTIVVSGVIANKYQNGGAVWTRLNWVLGFRKLGFQVYFVEQIGRQSCVDAAGAVTLFAECENLAYFKRITEQFGLADSAALVYEEGDQIYGLTWAELLQITESADLLVNITGHLTLEPLLRRLRRKAYVDLDPGFTQIWHAQGNAGARLKGHDYYFTVGENIGTSGCAIPTGGIRWRPTRQPVVLEHWPVAPAAEPERFTTVASWRGTYGPVEYEGKTFGLKVHEFRKFLELPQRAPGRFEVALDIHPGDVADRERLLQHGWILADPVEAAGDPERFRSYIQNSGAEFSVAQGIYVATHSGWFSDRSVRYLASAKPALVQDTGFSRTLPVGEGLVAFRTLDEAVTGAASIVADYERHAGAARMLAEEFFDSSRVLGNLLEQVGIACS